MTPRTLSILDIVEENRDTAYIVVVASLVASFHEKTRAVLLEKNKNNPDDSTIQNLKNFFHARFKALGLVLGDRVELTLRPYNKGDKKGEHKLGLQSIEVNVIDKDGCSKLLSDEVAAPTIGVITPDLLGGKTGVETALAAFTPDAGEELRAMSLGGLIMDGVQEIDEHGEGENPKMLFPDDQPLVVMVPLKVRTILAQTNAEQRMLCRSAMLNKGVYACRYIKKPAETVPDKGKQRQAQEPQA